MDSREQKEKEAWRKVGYIKKFSHAFRGLRVFWATTEKTHLTIYILATGLVIFFGCYFCVSATEWALLALAVSSVLVAEIFNTAIEIDIDLTSPEYHPYARDTKDTAAAGVLVAVFFAVLIGLIVFLPKVILYVNM